MLRLPVEVGRTLTETSYGQRRGTAKDLRRLIDASLARSASTGLLPVIVIMPNQAASILASHAPYNDTVDESNTHHPPRSLQAQDDTG